MKKILSFLMALTVAASVAVMPTTVSADAVLTLYTDVNVIDADQLAEITEDIEIPDGYTAYDITYSVQGLALNNDGTKTKPDGTLINNLVVFWDITAADAAKIQSDSMSVAPVDCNLDGLQNENTSWQMKVMATRGYFPAKGDSYEATEKTDAIAHTIIFLKPEDSITLTLNKNGTMVGIGDWAGSATVVSGTEVTYKTSTGEIALDKDSITLGTVTPPPSDEYAFSAGTENKYDNGIVWAGASMTNFDTTENEYWAIFNAKGEDTDARKTQIKGLEAYESTGSVTFDAVMWFAGEAKENVTFRIDEVPMQ